MFRKTGRGKAPALNADVHVWCVDLDALAERVEHLQDILSEDERIRASRFYFQRDAWRYIVARSTLRILLGQYIHVSPDLIKFHYNKFGKPFLQPNDANGWVNFNASHSAHLALYAFGAQEEIGVDIEQHRSELAAYDIAQRHFSALELESLQGLSSYEFVRAFFNCWTRKEAYIKAKGLGLSLALDSFAVETKPVSTPLLLFSKSYPQDQHIYSLRSFEPAQQFSAALAVNDKAPEIKYFTFE